MIEFRYTVTRQVGIHAHPAGLLAKAAKNCKSRVTVTKGGRTVSAKNWIALMSLYARTGDTVIVQVEGATEERDAAVLERFFRENL